MFIGSNNSLTYLTPRNKWLRYLKRFGRCQDADYDDQYSFYGVRLFDFRLYCDKNSRIVIKNGRYIYSLFSFYEILDYLNKKCDAIVFITLDSPQIIANSKTSENVERKFTDVCNIVESIYEDIRFCGGHRRFDNKQLYNFVWEEKNGTPKIICPHDWSRLYRLVTKWCPMFIGKLNSKYIEKYKDENVYLALNYVDKGQVAHKS